MIVYTSLLGDQNLTCYFVTLLTCLFCIFSGIGLKQRVTDQLRSAGAFNVSESQIESLCNNLLRSKSDSTFKKYNYSFNAWKKFCVDKNYSFLPGAPIIVALYLSDLKSSTGTGSYHQYIVRFMVLNGHI